MDVANVMLVRPNGEAAPIPLDAFTDRSLDLNDGVLHRNQDHLNNHHPNELREAVATRTYIPADTILAAQITSLSADGFEFQWVDEHGAHSAHTTFDRPARTPEDLVAGVRKALAAEISTSRKEARMVVQTLRSIGGYAGAVAGTPVRMIAPTRASCPAGSTTRRCVRLSEASVEMYFNAFKDVDWDAPEMALPEDDERWILPTIDLLGAHPWYQSLPKARQIEVGRHRLTAIVKTGSQFEQLLLLGGTQFLMGVDNGDPEFRYFMHELTEETHHIQMFQEFTNRVCPDVAGAPDGLMRSIPLVGHLGGALPRTLLRHHPGRRGADRPCAEGGHARRRNPPAPGPDHGHPHRRGGPPHRLRAPCARGARPLAQPGLAPGPRHPHPARDAPGLRRDHHPLARRPGHCMGLPDSVAREVWGTGPEAAAFRRHLFADVRMLFDNLGLRTPLTRWSWRVLGVDGRPARFRAEPPSAAA